MLKRLLLSAIFATACSSGGAAATDAGTADVGVAPASACEALCASSTCATGCAAACAAGGAAVPQCETQYTAVVRCAERSGQRCMFAQGGGASCSAEGRAYSDCVSGGGDAGSSPTDAGSSPTDTGAVTGASLVGRWTLSTTAPMFEYELNFMGAATSGTVRYQSVNTLTSSGCVTTNVYSGRWTRTGGSLSLTLDAGTTEVTMCTDSSMNRDEMALPAENLASVSTDFTGPVTVSESELTFTMFRGTSTRTFSRAP